MVRFALALLNGEAGGFGYFAALCSQTGHPCWEDSLTAPPSDFEAPLP